MGWMVFAFLTAVFESAKDVLGKRTLRTEDPYLTAWGWRFFALPFLLPLLPVFGMPSLGESFWGALAISGGLNVVTAVLYMKALQASDLSLTVPMVAFSPLFLLVTSPLLLGEFPGAAGLAGVVLVVTGSYLMKAPECKRSGVLSPFRALVSERGPRLMLLVALIWSITANVDKIGILNSSPLLWAIASNAFIAAVLSPVALLRRAKASPEKRIRALVPIGAAGGLTTLCQMTAISMTLVPYVIAIKRTSILMSILWGWLFFREQEIKGRLGGATVMLFGMALILLDGVGT